MIRPQDLMETVEHDQVRVTLQLGTRPLLQLSGVLREQDVDDWLNPFLQLVEKRIKEVGHSLTIDVRDLEYMNAASFRTVASWIKELTRHDDCSYVEIRTNSKHRWQVTGVHAIKVVGGPKVIVDE